jgi:hypothetical protein
MQFNFIIMQIVFLIEWIQFRGKLLFLFTLPDTQYDIHVVNTKNYGFNSVGFTTICSLICFVSSNPAYGEGHNIKW